MTRKSITILGKTLGDLSDPRVLAAYAVVYIGVLGFLALAFGQNIIPDGGGDLPVAEQGVYMFGAFLAMSHLWALGIGLLLFGAVAGANTLAREAERGTLRIVLSKQVRRWEVLLGTFVGITLFVGLVGVANALVGAVALFWFSDVSAAALEVGVFDALSGTVAYALFVGGFVASLSLALSVFTKNRLQTALGLLVVPALYFALSVARLFGPEFYEDNALYLADMSYHFGNAFVVIHEAIGGDLPVEAQQALSIFSGVYDLPSGENQEALPESLELAGHVDPMVSVSVLVGVAAVSFLVALVEFQRTDL